MSTEDVPSVDGLPILGTALPLARDPAAFRRRICDRGDVIRVADVTGDCYFVTRPEAVERVLVSASDRFQKPDLVRQALGDVGPSSMVTAEGERWKRLRTVVQSELTAEAVPEYADAVVAATRGHVAEWRDGRSVEVVETGRQLGLSSFGAAMFDDDFESLAAPIPTIAGAMQDRARIGAQLTPDWLPSAAERRLDRATTAFGDAVADAVAGRRVGDPGDDLLGILVEAADDGRLSDRELQDQLFASLFPAYGNAGLTIGHVLFRLARSPSVQRRVATEVTALDGDPGFPDLPALTLTDAVVSETLRLHPPEHEYVRTPVEDVTLCGYSIPAGETIKLPVREIQRDDEWWDEPETFRPSRWLDGGPSAPEHAYVPFGAGPRVCVARRFANLQLRLAVATICRRFRLELADGQSADPRRHPVTFDPLDGIEVRLTERDEVDTTEPP